MAPIENRCEYSLGFIGATLGILRGEHGAVDKVVAFQQSEGSRV